MFEYVIIEFILLILGYMMSVFYEFFIGFLLQCLCIIFLLLFIVWYICSVLSDIEVCEVFGYSIFVENSVVGKSFFVDVVEMVKIYCCFYCN